MRFPAALLDPCPACSSLDPSTDGQLVYPEGSCGVMVPACCPGSQGSNLNGIHGMGGFWFIGFWALFVVVGILVEHIEKL